MDLQQILDQLEPDVSADEQCFVSLYTRDRRYGGPEEGGWWYDWWTWHGSKKCMSREEAERLRDRLVNWAKGKNEENAPERWRRTAEMPTGPDPYLDTEGYIPRGWGDGGEYEIVIEDVAGERARDQQVPHYC